MATRIASRKAKGRNLQQYIRDLILAFFPLFPDDVRSTSMGAAGVDVQLSPKARQHFNFDIEAKNDENKSVWHCWNKAVFNEKQGKALLIMKKNHHEPLAILRATDFMNIIAELDKFKNKECYFDNKEQCQVQNL